MLRIVEQRDASPDERAIDEIATSIYAFRRDLLGPALRAPVARQRAGRVLPHRRRRRARRHGPPRRSGPGAAARRPRASTTAGSWPSPSASCGSRTNRHWLLNGVTMLDPRQTFIDVTVQPRPRRHAVPGHDPRGQHGRRRRQRDRPAHPPRRLRGRAQTAGSSTRSASRPRSATGPGSGRTATCRPVRTSPRARRPVRSTLRRTD